MTDDKKACTGCGAVAVVRVRAPDARVMRLCKNCARIAASTPGISADTKRALLEASHDD